MIKLYAALGAVVLIALALWRYDYVMSENERLTESLKTMSATLRAEREEAEKIAALRDAYYTDLTEAKAKNEQHEKCVADGTCVVTVRVRVPASCPAPANGDTAGAETAAAELDAAAGRAYSNLRSAIHEHQEWDKYCVNTLAVCAKR